MKKILLLIWSVTAFVLLSTGMGSAITCPGSYSKTTWTNCQSTYIWANGDKYSGEWVDGEQNGQGTYTYANGFVEEGIWKDGSFQFAKKTSPKLEGPKQCPSDSSKEYHNCFGTYIYDNGDKYVGEWKNDEENGQGTYYFLADDEFKGDIFEGTFVGGTASGYGKYFFLADNEFKGDVREGTYVDWVLNGPGTYTWEDGSTYNGAFKDSLFDGFGILAVIDGDSYHGNFREGFAEGLGWLLDKDGNLIFEGQFADGEPIDPNQKETPNSQTVQNPEEVVPAASGTGFYVSKNGHIVTNHHVINGCKEIDVIANGESLSTKVVAFDQVNDVALLKVANEPEEYLPISTKRAELLEDIYVAGFPFGNELSSSVKVTRGIVSSLTGFKNNYSQIQIDAAIQQGNSGGPILNSFGNVIGVAVSKADTSFFLEEFDAIPENVNFGVKSSVVLNLLDANGVNIRPPNTEDLSTKTLGQKITKATLYLSCGMTMAQIEAMLTQKAMFNKYK